MTEADLQRDIQAALRSRGAYVVKYPAGAFGAAGTPDLIVCWRGRFAALEVKMPGRALSAIQQVRIAEVVQSGGRGAVVTSVAEALRAVGIDG